jgi:hypothetical protein
LTKFDISTNNLYAAGAKALVEGLQGNQVMTELNLAGNELGKEAPGMFGQKADMSGIIALADIIPGMGALTSLILKDNRLLTVEAGKILSGMWLLPTPYSHTLMYPATGGNRASIVLGRAMVQDLPWNLLSALATTGLYCR